jgi:putative oxidoreductase
MDRLNRWAPLALGILRIVTALVFIEHGGQKLFGFPPGENPPVGFAGGLMTVAGVLEFFGGILILLGLFTRPVAFILSGFMAAAYWMAHAPQNPFPVNNGGDAAILYCFIFLYLVFAGPGSLSLDDTMMRRRR